MISFFFLLLIGLFVPIYMQLRKSNLFIYYLLFLCLFNRDNTSNIATVKGKCDVYLYVCIYEMYRWCIYCIVRTVSLYFFPTLFYLSYLYPSIYQIYISFHNLDIGGL